MVKFDNFWPGTAWQPQGSRKFPDVVRSYANQLPTVAIDLLERYEVVLVF